MPDFSDERKVFETYFKSLWNADPNAGGAIVQYENVKFTQPKDQAWCRFAITASNTNPAALGGMKVRTRGFVYLSIFVPKDSGTATGKSLGDAFSDIWDLIHLKMANGVANFQTTTIKTLGDHNGFFASEAMCAYWRDSERPAPNGGTFGVVNP